MPESPGGVDLATLGLELDAREFVARGEQSIKALDRLGRAGDEAERTTKSLSGAMRDAADSAGQQVTAAQRLSQAQEEFAAARREREEAEAAQREQRGDQEVQVARRTAEEVAAERERINAEQEAKWRASQEQRAAEDRARAERSGAEEARARAEALQRQFAADVARIREGQARGFLSPAEAREAGREAAREFNQGMVETIDQGFRAGAFSGGEGRDLRTNLASSLKNVDEAGKSASVGVGRLNQSLVSLLRQTTGTNPAVAQLANVLGSFAIGTGVMAGALAGLAALGVAYRRLTADARENAEALKAARSELDRVAERRTLGPGGSIAESVRLETAALEDQRLELVRVEKQLEALQQLQDMGLSGVLSGPGGTSDRERERRIQALRDEIDERNRILREGAAEVRDILLREAESTRSAQNQALAALVSGNQATEQERERARMVLRRAQEEEARLAAGEMTTESLQERARLIALIQSMTGALEGQGNAAAREAETSRARIADMRIEVEQQERLLEAVRRGTEAYETAGSAIERENAIRQAGASVREQERQQAEELAAAAFDRARAIEEEIEARSREDADAGRGQELAEIEALRELTDSYAGSVEGLREAQADLIREQEIAREVEQTLAEGTNRSREEVEAMIRARHQHREAIEQETAAREAAEAFESDVEDLTRELRERRQLLRIHQEHEGSQKELTDAVKAYNRELRVQAALQDLIARNPSLTDEDIERYRALADELAAVNDELDDISTDSADTFEDAWLAAVNVVGASLGGLASQVANIVSAFATGGLVAGGTAMAGTLVNRLTGDRGQAERDRAEAMERSTRELERFAEALRESVTELEQRRTDAVALLVQGLQSALPDNIQLDLSASESALASWAQAIGRGEASMDDLMDWFRGLAYDVATAEFRAGDLNRGARDGRARELMDEWSEFLDGFEEAARAIEERRQADIGRIEDRLEIRQFEASGDREGAAELRRQKELEKELAEARALESKALEDKIQKTWAMEEATRKAAEATAALRSARDEELSLQHREAMLRGDQRAALHARLQRQAEAELNALQDRLDAGKISEEHFRRVADIIRGEVNQALAEMAQRAREAAEAERFRQAMDTENLRVRLLRMQGLHVEAAQLEANIALQNAMNEGRNAEYIAILRQINALQIQEAAQRNVASAAQEMNRTLQDTTRMLNAPSGISNALIRHRAFRGLEGAGPAPVNRVQQSTQTQTVHMTFGDLSFPNVTEPTDVKRMLRELLTEGQKQARAGSGNVFVSGMD